MITRRDQNGRLECIRQPDHAAISGALADAWRHAEAGAGLSDVVRFAVHNHDVAWIGLDASARLRTDGRPHSFLDHPLEPKYRAWRAGIDLLEAGSEYAGYLCSVHYGRLASMLDDDRSVAYRQAELVRQERLAEHLDAGQRATAGDDIALLRLLDAVSLYVCCNTPGRDDWAWNPEGFAVGATKYRAAWLDATHVRLDPYPLADAVRCVVPGYGWNEQGRLVEPVQHSIEFVR